MKTIFITITIFLLSFLIQKGKAQNIPNLKEKIIQLDSLFFTAYNNCDMKTQADFYSDTIEFFHDKSGLTTDKQKILADTKKYICGKVARELIPGSIEVSPLPNYGAVEIGMHQFRNKQEPNAQPHPSRFLIIWKQEGENWKISKVISLHEN